jgi:hypothetical protein
MGYPLEGDFDPVEFLVERKLGTETLAVLPPSILLRKPASSPRDHGYRAAANPHAGWGYRTRRHEEAEAYRKELHAMAPSEFEALLKSEQEKQYAEIIAKQNEEERKRFYNQPHAMADVSYWSRAPYWTVEEAVALAFGKNPQFVNWEKLDGSKAVSNFIQKYGQVRAFAVRACAMGQLSDPVIPNVFLHWMKKTGFPFPEDLEAAIIAHSGALVDWKAQYDNLLEVYQTHKSDWERTIQDSRESTQRAIAERDAARADLESERQRAQEAAASEKPLGRRERESMLKLIAGMAMEGYRHNPAAARNETVKEIVGDLHKQGVSLSDDTVRRYLTEAIEHLKDAKA